MLLGPRATGKSTWIEEVLPKATRFDLLDTRLAREFAAQPELFAREVEALPAKSWVVVDEVQKVPALLDEVQRLDGKAGRRFLLSGSSARKLRRGGANLLAGRALRHDMFPLVSAEIGAAPELERVHFGTLPRVVDLERPHAYLSAYVETYLREEVQAEALTRSIGGFSRFLEVAARQNGQVTNVSSIARDAQLSKQNGYMKHRMAGISVKAETSVIRVPIMHNSAIERTKSVLIKARPPNAAAMAAPDTKMLCAV